uniref:Long-chain fatty acid transport protein 1 n=1 Tax=Lygus hesperus TaxID=30085 RepID=A0A0A9Z8P7_LYGHE
MHYLPAFPFRVVKYDECTQEIWRDTHHGYSRRVGVHEVGEILGEIVNGFDLFALRRFDGYHHSKTSFDGNDNKSSIHNGSSAGEDHHTAQKIVRHVLWPSANSTFFRSGDLVMFDKFGFVTFIDRVGDTFR